VAVAPFGGGLKGNQNAPADLDQVWRLTLIAQLIEKCPRYTVRFTELLDRLNGRRRRLIGFCSHVCAPVLMGAGCRSMRPLLRQKMAVFWEKRKAARRRLQNQGPRFS
jgi:hypothetical protein